MKNMKTLSAIALGLGLLSNSAFASELNLYCTNSFSQLLVHQDNDASCEGSLCEVTVSLAGAMNMDGTDSSGEIMEVSSSKNYGSLSLLNQEGVRVWIGRDFSISANADRLLAAGPNDAVQLIKVIFARDTDASGKPTANGKLTAKTTEALDCYKSKPGNWIEMKKTAPKKIASKKPAVKKN